jgi:hypothetical protein
MMMADNTNRGAPPPASESSEVTADLVHGAPAAEAMSPPRNAPRNDNLPKLVSGGASSFGSIDGPMAMSKQLSDQMAQELAIAADGFKRLMQSRTPIEFFMTQSRLMSEFYGRLMQRSVSMVGSMPGLAKRSSRLSF